MCDICVVNALRDRVLSGRGIWERMGERHD